ncbi:unnamed protein product [marine sediment metagenome]|uniref:Uncharacterized protein n=1 Tax=marine sediment metagenome TaxID=412755 RepID=X1EHC0_9ZZZZ
MAKKASKSPPKKCGDAFVLRCIGPSQKGEYRCSVFPMDSKKTCGGAVINVKKGTVRFYE